MKTVIIMDSCASILKSSATSSSPVVVEVVDVVEVTSGKEAETITDGNGC